MGTWQTIATALRGAANIARVIGCSCGNVYALKKRGLPAFKKISGPTSPLIARRADLLAWLMERDCGALENKEQDSSNSNFER